MAIKRGKLEFHNVVTMHTRCTYGKWQEKLMQFRAFLVNNDIFITGPIMVRWGEMDETTREADVSIYLPTHQRLQIPENELFSYQETFLIEDGLKLRHADLEDDIKSTEALLEIMAAKAELEIQKPFYYIYLPVYQEYVVDIFAAIEEGEIK